MSKSKGTYFNIDARIFFQLIEQLVTDKVVALAELIKNVNDVDASVILGFNKSYFICVKQWHHKSSF